jgi:hypothetical protein
VELVNDGAPLVVAVMFAGQVITGAVVSFTVMLTGPAVLFPVFESFVAETVALLERLPQFAVPVTCTA